MRTLHRVACVIGLCLISSLLQAAEPVVCVTEEGLPTFEHCERHATAVKSQDLTRYAGRPVPHAVVQENIRAAKWNDYTEQRCHGDTDCLNRIYERPQAIATKFTRFIGWVSPPSQTLVSAVSYRGVAGPAPRSTH